MKKIISFSLFGARSFTQDNFFEFAAYMRGFYWNVRMAKLIFPDWQVHCEVDSNTFSDFDNIFYGLQKYYGISFSVNEPMPLCKAMLTRLKPCFFEHIDYVLCRDTDALLSYRETQTTQAWMESYKGAFSIKDNPAHSVELMGGLVGFKGNVLKDLFGSWDKLLEGWTDWERGGDQQLMMKKIYPLVKDNLCRVDLTEKPPYGGIIDWLPLAKGIDKRLWCSNLCSFFSGSAGVNELETLRFMRYMDTETEFEEIAKRYSRIFYWYA